MTKSAVAAEGVAAAAAADEGDGRSGGAEAGVEKGRKAGAEVGEGSAAGAEVEEGSAATSEAMLFRRVPKRSQPQPLRQMRLQDMQEPWTHEPSICNLLKFQIG